MKKSTVISIFVLLAASICITSLSALEFEVKALGESSWFSRSDDGGELEVTAESDLHLNQALFAGMGLELAFFLDYTFLNSPDEQDHDFSGDIEIARLKGSIGPAEYSLGRSILQDFSSLILNTPADGLSLDFKGSDVLLSASAGITGLLLDTSSELIPTYSEDDRVDPLLAPNRLIFLFGLEYPLLSSDAGLYTDFIVNFDIPEENDFTGDNYDSYTLGTGLDGMFLNGAYSLFLFIQQGNYYGEISRDYLYTQSIAAAVGGEIIWKELVSPSDTLRLLLTAASGDSSHPLFGDAGGGLSSQFMPVTRTDSRGIYDYLLSNLVYFETEYAFAPVPGIPGFRTTFSAAAVMRPSEGEGTFEKITATDTPAGFMGTEILLTSEYSLVSGFVFNAGAGVFIPVQKFRDFGVFPENGIPFSVSIGCSYQFNYATP